MEIKPKKLLRIYFGILSVFVYFVVLFVHIYQTESGAVRPQANRPANTSLSLITEPNDGTAPLISLIKSATSGIDLVIYEISDKELEIALVNAVSRGIPVRVLINEKTWNGKEMAVNKANKSSAEYLGSHGVAVRATPSHFALTHQKTLIVDKSTAVIMTFNLVKKYYKTGRDFGIIDKDPNDVSEIESVFESDWNYTISKENKTNDLVWSPHSRDQLLEIINSAQKLLLVYNEEMADSEIEQALKNASERGVKVFVEMTDSGSWHDAFNSLSLSKVQIHTYPANSKQLYIHAKMIIADGNEAFLGSENFSSPSLEKNRELGIIFTDQEIIKKLQSTFAFDWASSKEYVSQ